MNEKMERQILLPAPIRKEIDAKFKCGRNELARALAYERNGSRAKMLRVAALEAGGVIYTGAHAPNGFCPNVNTHFDHAARVISQNFGDRVVLRTNRETHAAAILIDGAPVAMFDKLTLREWGDALYSLQQIYNQLTETV